MKLTTKGRYAVMAMADLATNANGSAISLTEISLRQNISLAYLEQIFIKLKSKKLVKVQEEQMEDTDFRKPASEIKLSYIISAVDEEVKMLNCKKILKKDVIINLQNALLIIYGMN